MAPEAGRDGPAPLTSFRLTLAVAFGASAVLRPKKKAALAHLVPRLLSRSPLAVASLGVIALWIAAAIAAPLIAPYHPLAQDIAGRLAPPSPAHWLGTDPLGRDILSRILYGARLSIPVGVTAVALAMILGTIIGSAAGAAGGVVDNAIMRTTDLMLAFPTVILAMIISAALGAGIRNAVIATIRFAIGKDGSRKNRPRW